MNASLRRVDRATHASACFGARIGLLLQVNHASPKRSSSVVARWCNSASRPLRVCSDYSTTMASNATRWGGVSTISRWRSSSGFTDCCLVAALRIRSGRAPARSPRTRGPGGKNGLDRMGGEAVCEQESRPAFHALRTSRSEARRFRDDSSARSSEDGGLNLTDLATLLAPRPETDMPTPRIMTQEPAGIPICSFTHRRSFARAPQP